MNPPTDPIKKPLDLTWHEQQEKLLKNWAEIASSYRWMHYQAYMSYKTKNLWYMIPLIVMSTVTGTANFAQSSFPEIIRPNVPQIIGAINLISAIITTIYQFLKISEFMESHRISFINYGKLSRSLTVELNLPVKDRSSGGSDCVKSTRAEIDRLIEQSPSIPKNVIVYYESKWSGKGLAEPEIVIIKSVDIYKDTEDQLATTIANAGIKLKEIKKTKFKNLVESIKLPTRPSSPTAMKKQNIKSELENIKSSKLVSSLKSMFKFDKKELIENPSFDIPPHIILNMATSIPDTETDYMNEIIQEPITELEVVPEVIPEVIP